MLFLQGSCSLRLLNLYGSTSHRVSYGVTGRTLGLENVSNISSCTLAFLFQGEIIQSHTILLEESFQA